MPYKFNPFTGNFDEVESGGSGGSPGGTSGQLQFNDGGSFSGVASSSVDVDGNVTLRTATVNAPSGYTGNLLDLNTQDGAPLKITNPQTGQFNIETYDTAGSFSPTLSFRFGPNGSLINRGIGIWNNGGTSVVIGYGIGQREYASGYIALDGSTTKVKNLGFNDIATLGSDLTLERDAANTLAQRRTTNAQTYRVYNTYTSSTNYERAKIEWDSNTLRIGTEKGSAGGTARDMELQTDGTTRITVKSDGAILFSGLPTSDPVVANQLWNDGGTLKISAG